MNIELEWRLVKYKFHGQFCVCVSVCLWLYSPTRGQAAPHWRGF